MSCLYVSMYDLWPYIFYKKKKINIEYWVQLLIQFDINIELSFP